MGKELKASDLSYEQQLFCLHYCIAVEKGIKAKVDYASKKVGINPGTGRRWVTFDSIKAEINRRMVEVAQPIMDKYAVTKERIIKRYAQIAFHDPVDGFVEEEDPETGRKRLRPKTVKEMDYDSRMGIGAKMSDVKGALDSLSRIEGMFNDKVNVEHTFATILGEIEQMDGSDEPLVNEEDDDE